MEAKKTPLYDVHLALGAKPVPFAGYLLPVQYGGIIAEHKAVRGAAGIFDVSHMGEAVLTGPDALENLNRLLTNDFTGLQAGRARYSPMCNEKGGTVDDLIVYRVGENSYLIVLNASNREKDVAWIGERVGGRAVFRDISDEVGQIALQGPASRQILLKLVDPDKIPEKYYSARTDGMIGPVRCIISRTGYTGEDGFEFYCAADDTPLLWEALSEAGKPEGITPCGLGARDTLRFEAAMPLYGHELDEDITPLECGLGKFARLDKPEFTGREALLRAGEPERVRIGLKVGGGILREHVTLMSGGKPAGRTTSGTFCPTLGGAYAMAYVRRELAGENAEFTADMRGRTLTAVSTPLPFYRRAR